MEVQTSVTESAEVKSYIKSSTPINKNLSVLDLETNSLKKETWSLIKGEHKVVYESLLKCSNLIFPNKFDVYIYVDKLLFLYEVGDLPFYYSNQNKVHEMKGCYVGFLINYKIGTLVTHMCMLRDKFSLKEYYKDLWHQSHASSEGDFIKTMCFGSNKYMQVLNRLFKDQSSQLQQIKLLNHLKTIEDQIQYENPKSPLNGTVKEVNSTPVKGVVKYKYEEQSLASILLNKSIKESLKKNVKFTYKNSLLTWLKFKEEFRKSCSEFVTFRTFYYEGEDYVRSRQGKPIPTTKYIETYEFRGQVRDRVIYDLENYSDNNDLVKKILESPKRLPQKWIEGQLNEICNLLNRRFNVYLVKNKKQNVTKHLAYTLDQKADLKIKRAYEEEE